MIRLATIKFLSLLEDLFPIAQSEAGLSGYAGILLHAADVEEGGEPGSTRCLVGTSSNHVSIGHCWVEADGSLPPTLLPITCVKTLRAALPKLLPKEDKKNHVVQLWREGDHVLVAEDPDLFGGGWEQHYAYGNLDDWPREVFPLLASARLTPPSDWKPLENRTDYSAKRLAAFLAIADRHGGSISTYRAHQRANVHIQIGYHYRGLLVPSAGWNESSSEDGLAPTIGVYAADLPALSTQQATPDPVSA
ncbi:hypothetical protein [Actinosynnema sp. NPDC023587]|uniref:hypothetical protein n=1 Tax=Actinosynnema sp. NPDC023587 TaxID=3154695 RepID=UPI0033CA7345